MVNNYIVNMKIDNIMAHTIESMAVKKVNNNTFFHEEINDNNVTCYIF